MSKPDPAAVSAAAQELYQGFLKRFEEGEDVPFESFLDEHLDHAADLQRLHARWQRLAGAVDALGDDAPSVPGATLRLVGDDDAASADPTSREAVDKLIGRLSARPSASARYGTRGELGRGGMGVVLRAWDGDLRRQLAMKVMLPPDPKASDSASSTRQLGRFLEEAQITGQLDHPGIVPVHELGLDDTGRVYFTMRLVRGRSLRTIFELVHDQRDGWTVPRTLNVLQKVCEALAYAHSKGVLHRDIKPANIMVGRFGEVYVMDWGLAKVLEREGAEESSGSADDPATLDDVQTERHDASSRRSDSPLRTLDGAVVGTPAYMSPEQARGELEELGPSSDVYAVGALLYHLLAGEMPFVPNGERRGPREVLRALREGPPRPLHQINRRVDPELAAICDKAMAREARDRYADMSEMADELRAFLEGRVVRAHRTGALVELRKWVVRNKLTAAVLLVFLLAMTGLGVRERQRNQSLVEATHTAQTEQAHAEQARAEAEAAKSAAEASATRADLALVSAEQATARALRQGYMASLAAAQAALADGSRAELLRQLEEAPAALRGWEWEHLRARADVSLGRFGRHDAAVSALRVSPDGQRVLSASWVGELDLWDAATGQRLARFDPGESAATDVLFSADSTQLVIASGDGQVRLLGASNGALLGSLEPPEGATRRAPEITRLARAASSDLVVAGRDDGRVLAWRLDTGNPYALPRPHAQEITDLALSHDGSLLVSASRDRTVALIDVVAGELLDTLYDYDSEVLAVAHSPVAERFASAEEAGVVRVYSVGSQVPEHEFDVAPEVPTRLLFTPDGAQLVAGMASGNLRVWDAWTGRELDRMLGHDDGVSALCSTPDGLRILSGSLDGALLSWDLSWGAAQTQLMGHTDSVRSLAAAAGRRLLSASWDGRARLWDSGALLSLGVGDLPGGGGAAVALSNSGTLAAAGLNDASRHQDFPLIVWKVSDTGELAEHRRLLGHQEPIHAVSFESSGRLLASASDDRSARVWDVERGALTRTLEGHGSRVRDVVFHPSRPWIATASFDESVRIWSLDDGAQLLALHDHTRGVLSVTFSPDGRWLASAGEDRQVLIYDTKDTPQLVARLQGHRGVVNDLAFHPSGERLASASSDGSVRIWSVPEGNALLSLEAGAPADALAFSTDGARLHVAAGSRILTWETGSAAPGFAQRHDRAAALEPAQQRFTDLLEALEDPRAVADALRADTRLDPVVREEALRLVRNFGSDPALLTEAARGLLLERHADPETCREARRLARAANRLAPGQPRVLHVLGLAQYRCGNDRAALEALTEAKRLNASLREYPVEWDLLVLAMANTRLGASALAEAYLDEALLSLGSRGEPPGPTTNNLVREARRLVTGER
ncbi:MAG: hypothetical protein DHS20C15_18960 [Planctomycetota bacterium]|nr:MAG: hypothetical protein DHS20C15_18960 [Planctomycetota bacterium]